MDRYVTIQQKTVTADSYGAESVTWSTRVKTWAERRDLSMSERMQAAAVKSNTSARYYVRYNPDIAVTDRLVDGFTTLEINGIVEVGRKKGLDLICGTI